MTNTDVIAREFDNTPLYCNICLEIVRARAQALKCVVGGLFWAFRPLQSRRCYLATSSLSLLDQDIWKIITDGIYKKSERQLNVMQSFWIRVLTKGLNVRFILKWIWDNSTVKMWPALNLTENKTWCLIHIMKMTRLRHILTYKVLIDNVTTNNFIYLECFSCT
jgi:hypothetical protein